jgi:hypothetical protein
MGMKKHSNMIQQKKLVLISLLTGSIFLFFNLFHSAIMTSVTMLTHHGRQSISSQQTNSSTGTCIQQCTVVNSDNKLQNKKHEEADPLKPFESLLAVVALASGILYLAPHTVRLVKRKLKIPIYKQVACFRI